MTDTLFSLRALWRGLLLAGLCAGLTGCASMSRDECVNNDMYNKGLADGEQGYAASRLASHQDACGEYGIRLDGDSYMAGRAEGLKQYCTQARGEQVGRAGGSYQGVCPAPQEAAFMRGFKRGKMFYEIEQKQAELDRIRKKLADDKLELAERKRLTQRLDQVHSELNLLLLERAR